jgi:hypothetical protein
MVSFWSLSAPYFHDARSHELKTCVMLYATLCKPKLPVTVDTAVVTICTVALSKSAFPVAFCVILVLTEDNQLLFPCRASTDCCCPVNFDTESDFMYRLNEFLFLRKCSWYSD